MPSDLQPVLTLLLVAVIANLVVMGLVLIPPMLGRRSPMNTGGRPVDAPDQIAAEFAAVAGEAPVPYEPGSVPTVKRNGPKRPSPAWP